LLAGGRPPETPVALVNWGTHPEQRTLVSSLASVVHDAEVAGARSPSVIIVGEVVSLRSELAWFDNRPLFGLTGLVTRTRHQASDLSSLLRQHGAVPLEMPVIRLEPPESWAPVDEALAVADSFDWVVFTSANGVAMLQDHLADIGSDIRALKGPQVAAIGPATAAAAKAAGLHVSLCPDEYVAEALVAALAAEGLAGKRLLLLRAAQARDVLPDQARAAGAEVVIAPVYQTLPVESLDPQIVEMLAQKQVDFVTFASSSSVNNFVQALGDETARTMLAGVCVACIGPITAASARAAGLSPTVVPDEYTIEALVAALVDYYATNPRRSGT
jgi:uroporphyrinogen III methyltransferase/synthase